MSVLLHPKAARALEKLDREIKERIKKKLAELEKNPKKGKIFTPTDFRSLRIGDYRVIYEIQDDDIVVLFVGHRKNVYNNFFRVFF